MDFPRPIKLWEWVQDFNGYTLVNGRWTDHLGRKMDDTTAKEIDQVA